MIEHDLLGNIVVPDEKYYGAQTQRALELCPPSRETLECYPELIYHIAAIKKAYAMAHAEVGVFEKDLADSIIQASEEVMSRKMSGEFLSDIICGGGCVNIHMNVNEVIAKRANEILTGDKEAGNIHPNTHVNKGQSTNDVIPAAMKLALYHNLLAVRASAEVLKKAYAQKAEEYKNVVKVSRTCVQDAVPITFGQFFGAAVSFLNRQIHELTSVMQECRALPLGATAVGTGLNIYEGVSERVYDHLTQMLGVQIVQEENLFDGLQYADIYVKVSAVMKALITGISKMARDIRFMSSGPRSGINEIHIAPVQNGSSIMPGKVNPALPESMNVLAYITIGTDASVTAAAEGGELELNVWEPVIISELLWLTQVSPEMIKTFANKCVSTIVVNREYCQREAEETLSSAAIISALKGYQIGTEVAQYADKNGLTLKEAVVQCGYMSAEEADQFLDPLMLTDVSKTGKLLLEIDKKNHK